MLLKVHLIMMALAMIGSYFITMASSHCTCDTQNDNSLCFEETDEQTDAQKRDLYDLLSMSGFWAAINLACIAFTVRKLFYEYAAGYSGIYFCSTRQESELHAKHFTPLIKASTNLAFAVSTNSSVVYTCELLQFLLNNDSQYSRRYCTIMVAYKVIGVWFESLLKFHAVLICGLNCLFYIKAYNDAAAILSKPTEGRGPSAQRGLRQGHRGAPIGRLYDRFDGKA
jgi:hypothetical protein